MSFNDFRDNYPMGYSGEEGQEEETYIIEIGGEVKVQGYSEEDADNEFNENLVNYLVEAFRNGDLYVL